MPRTLKTAATRPRPPEKRPKPAGKPARKAEVRLAPEAGEPLWRQLVETLRREILRGTWPVGSLLPTEEVLVERFSVSRHTVRSALQQLRADGLVTSRRGSGTTVMAPPPEAEFNVHRVASIDDLIAYAAQSRYAVERTELVNTESLADNHIGLPAGRNWLRLQGFRFKDDAAATPICWTEVFVASEYAGVERMLARLRGPIWQLIEDRYGERLVEIEQSLSVRQVPDALAEGLHVEPGSSVVEVCRTYRNTADKVAEVSVNLYPAAQFRFTMKLRRA